MNNILSIIMIDACTCLYIQLGRIPHSIIRGLIVHEDGCVVFTLEYLSTTMQA